ncbi:MAG: FecR domain-containing protein [Gammaproteobacteria bacterium]|nr:MAG: FecR domain-containing protein [Gammaproteobacteria bacterium]
MSERRHIDREADDSSLGGLVRQAGARPQPDARLREAVRSVVEVEWRAVVAQRARRRRQRWTLAAAAAVAGLAVLVVVPRLLPSGPVLATVARVEGPAGFTAAGWLATRVGARAGQPLRAGSDLRTGAGGRLALELGGASLRLDQHSELAIVAADRVELRHGALYLDSGPPGTAASRLVVATRFGSVEHLGTQYETRVSDQGLRLRVREGQVRLLSGDRVLQGVAGEQVSLGADGTVSREPVSRSGADWAWVHAVAPLYDIQDRPLIEFLGWVSRETGRDLVFDSPAAEQAAREVVLHGSVQGLSPEQALAAVLVTTGLQYSEVPGQLHVRSNSGD